MSYRDSIINFYLGTDYQSLRQSVPRPKEWHLPLLIYENFYDQNDYIETYKQGAKVILPLEYKDMKSLRTTLLHESLFSYYKAFYNYLAAKNLYSSGALHWIKITAYYSKLFLAGAINTLCGKRSYVVNRGNNFFVSDIYKILYPNKEITDKSSYTITLDLNIAEENGRLSFHKNRVNSHKDIWENYTNIDLMGLGLTKITYEEMFNNDAMHLSKERNIENYSFEGYSQIDFNLDIDNFKGYFERDYVKNEKELVYDVELGIVLGVVTELYYLYKSFSIDRLPIELNKFEYMISYMVDNPMLKEKLLNLVRDGLPLKNKYITEMNNFYSN